MDKYDLAYMKMAEAIADCSTSNRLKVGCIFVKDKCVVSEGLNGTYLGCNTNECEVDNVTSDNVVHAEMNAIFKAARTGRSLNGAHAYITHSCCFNCSVAIISSGVNKVFYKTEFRCRNGLDNLLNNNIEVVKLC